MIVKKSLGKPKNQKSRNPWAWVPSLYFAEGLPYIIVMFVAGVMYKKLGISNAEIALYTSWLYLPWVIKPLWSPVVDVLKTKRLWIIIMELIIGAGLAGVALTIPAPDFLQFTLLFFWLLAFSSATHDISVDGFYMLALTEKQQSFFVGIRSTFYRVAMITGQGLLIILAGYLEGVFGLKHVDFNVFTKPNSMVENSVNLDSTLVNPLPGELRIVTEPKTLEISSIHSTVDAVNFYINTVRTLNEKNGFVNEETEHIVEGDPLDTTGNVGIVYFHLSKQPEKNETYSINLERLNGSDDIKIIEGNDFTFNSRNWNKPAYSLIQIPANVTKRIDVTFKAQVTKIPIAWVITFGIIAGLFIVFFIYHKYILPKPVSDRTVRTSVTNSLSKEFFRSFFRFFEKDKIALIIVFILLYRLGESQIVKMASLFMLDGRDIGGLGLTTLDVGFIYGTVGVIALVIGGLLGGFAASAKGLKYWFWWMLIAINLPDVAYIYLSYFQPQSLTIIGGCVALEQFGYGFGFTAYLLYLIYISEGEFKTSHYAIATGFMALGMMVPGMFSGMIQEAIGYKMFFIWVLVATIPAFIIAKYIKIDPEFGKKK